ncbi:MAG TPA: SDR family NAD(P)-dependent oxidoreductase [Pelomicrobium sp.]|nr:SDR family NAD(P)-dependent oxidoreductase [Pelomicrobium sp.]
MPAYHPAADLLRERVILVTGAGQGLGRAAAVAYAAHGATVILHGRHERKLNDVYDAIERAGHPLPMVFPLDLATAGDAEFGAMAEAIRAQAGRLDGILHSAAERYMPSPLELQTLEAWLKALRVNLAAAAAVTRACLPLLREAPEASVVYTSDTHAAAPTAFWGALAASKAGVEALVRIQASEWEREPTLRVNAVVPGPTRSPQRVATHPGVPRTSLTPPEALGPLYLYLMGPDSKGESGRIIDAHAWLENF